MPKALAIGGGWRLVYRFCKATGELLGLRVWKTTERPHTDIGLTRLHCPVHGVHLACGRDGQRTTTVSGVLYPFYMVNVN